MGKFWRNCKGAVTVMVTLLLIPAVLITGTGVDLARIYTARSIVQDANQLAANSVLASYDALLQDLYGLFGFMRDNPELASMVQAQVELAVNGKSGAMGGAGEGEMPLQLFYGANLQPGAIAVREGWNLKNPTVLRRQIEEYAKFRAPVIIVEELMDKLDTFRTVQEDAKVIKKKMAVDDKVEEIDEWYRKIYNCITTLNQCPYVESTATNSATTASREIHGDIKDLSQSWEAYRQLLIEKRIAEEALEAAKLRLAAADDDEYAAAQKDVEDAEKKLAEVEEAMETEEAAYKAAALALSDRSRTWKKERDDFLEELSSYIDLFNDGNEGLLPLCAKAQDAKKDLAQKIQDLEGSLDGGCSPTLKKGLTEPLELEGGGTAQKSVIDQYKELLEYDLNAMADAMANGTNLSFEGDIQQITDTSETIETASLGDYNLIDFGEMGTLGILNTFPLPSEEEDTTPYAGLLSALPMTYQPKPPGFQLFQAGMFDGTKNRVFFEKLDGLYREGKGDEAGKSRVKDTITNLFKAAKSCFTNLFEGFDPEGAHKLPGGTDDSDPSTGSEFGTNDDYDWGSEDGGKNELEDSLDSDFLSILGNTAGAMGNKVLLVVYDSEMFSEYTTPGEERPRTDEYPLENMAGIPLSKRVNYYFQSELEYLYNGNLSDAVANLKSVAGMIFLIRFVFDYVASFSIPSVNSLVNSIRTALAWTGPFAILTAELARLAISMGESVMDVQRLRTGEKVAIYKTTDTWTFSLSGLGNMFKDAVSESAIKGALEVKNDSGEEREGDPGGMAYKDYLRLFLLLVDGDTLARRTANLIELNVTNYSKSCNAEENKMAAAERFDLSKAATDFSITTKVDMRMLFLSMPFAQKGIDGVVPPKTFPISATDYRGY